jgi:hypothetical protein
MITSAVQAVARLTTQKTPDCRQRLPRKAIDI